MSEDIADIGVDEGTHEYPRQEGIRLRLDIAYVGREFHGWQIQKDYRSVQGELRRCLTRLLGRELTPVAAGRTDARVNARGQVAHLSVRNEDEADRVTRALNRMCDPDVQIVRVRQVSREFHARFSAQARRYSYHLVQAPDIFRPHVWYIYQKLDQSAMDRAARHLLGAHDFTSFCKARSIKPDTNVCDVSLCAFEWTADSGIFHVKANRFLHHMVRNMMGTLAEIGRGERDADEMPQILAACSRSAAGRMAPANGLFLEEVDYPDHLMNPEWRGTAEPTPRSEP